MRDFLYDFRRTFTGRFTIVMVVLIILATLGITYAAVALSSGSTGSPGSTAYVMPEMYPSAGGYNITDFAVNGYGEPVQGLSISSSVTNSTTHVTTYLNGTTDSSGYLYFHLSISDSYVVYNYSSSYSNGIALTPSQGYLVSSPGKSAFYSGVPGSMNLVGYGQQNSTAVLYTMKVSNPNSKINSNEMLYYAAPNGTVMPSLDVYYRVSNGSGLTFPPSSSNGMIFDKTVGGSNYYLLNLPLNVTADKRQVVVGLFNSTGTFVGGNFPVLYSSVSTASILQSALELPYEFLIPIVGIFSAYFYYGKDKTSGVLESVITRPVTKGRLFVSRFVGNAATFLAALLLAMFFADVLLYGYTGSFIPVDSLLSIIIGYAIEAIAFSGIMYIISQYTRSQGALLGIGIGLFFLLVFVWGIIVELIIHFGHINTATAGGYAETVLLSAISPTFFPTMILSYDTGIYPPSFATFSVGPTVLASAVGITLFSVVLVGLIWVAIPSLVSFFLARSRD